MVHRIPDKYAECPECGHHKSNHKSKAVDRFYCGYGSSHGALGDTKDDGSCRCTKTREEIDKHIATFDDRVCRKCGMGDVDQEGGPGWVHSNNENCILAMGKRIISMEKEFFSRRAAIRDQKERKHG